MNYYEYFSEIEDRFTARRGSLLLLSTLDWALIETWREAGVPLAAVLRGIDTAFDRYEERKARARGRIGKVNGLAWCAQSVLQAAADLAQASVGGRTDAVPAARETGFEHERVAKFLESTAAALEQASGAAGDHLAAPFTDTAQRLHQLAAETRARAYPALDVLDGTLTVLEERLHATVLASLSEAELTEARMAAERELAPYRKGMSGPQLRQVRDQFVQKRLLERYGLPRLSLFYMPHTDLAGGEAS